VKKMNIVFKNMKVKILLLRRIQKKILVIKEFKLMRLKS